MGWSPGFSSKTTCSCVGSISFRPHIGLPRMSTPLGTNSETWAHATGGRGGAASTSVPSGGGNRKSPSYKAFMRTPPS